MGKDKVGAVVLAGAPAGKEMDPEGKLSSRAMVEINGVTMLQRVVDALTGAGSVGQIVAIGDVVADGVDRFLEPAGSMVDNIARAIPCIDSGRQVLVVCADIPMLTSAAVDDFVTRAGELGAELVYPIIEKSSCQGLYANMKRTYVKTADGCFTGGNIALIDRGFFTKNADSISRAYELRKKPVALAKMIGFGILFRFMIAQIYPKLLPLETIEKTASRLLGADLRALVTEYPEIGQDVDKIEDIAAAEEILSKGVTAGVEL